MNYKYIYNNIYTLIIYTVINKIVKIIYLIFYWNYDVCQKKYTWFLNRIYESCYLFLLAVVHAPVGVFAFSRCFVLCVWTQASWQWQIQACIHAVSTTLPSSCNMVLTRVCGTMPPAGHSSITFTDVAPRRSVFVTRLSLPIASLITSLFVRSAQMTARHNNTCSILHPHILHQHQTTPLTVRQENVNTRQPQNKTRPSLSPQDKTGPSLPPHSLHH